MWYTLLGKQLWAYMSNGTDLKDLVNFGTLPPAAIMDKSPEANVTEAKTFIVNDARANAIMCCRVSPLVSSNIPLCCDDSSHQTWHHLKATYECIDAAVQFVLHSQLSSLHLKDVSDAEHYLGEFNQACEQLTSARITHSKDDTMYQLLFSLLETGSWAVFRQITLAAIQASASQVPCVIMSSKTICACILVESQCLLASSTL